MKKNMFEGYPISKLTKYFWKTNWKIFFWFSLGWTIVLVVPLLITLPGYGFNVSFPFFRSVDISGNGETFAPYSVSSILKYCIYGVPGICYFSIFTLVLLLKNLLSDVKFGTIVIWVSLPCRREKFLLSRIFNIYFMEFLLFILSFLIVLLFSCSGTMTFVDFKKFIVFSLEFVIFIFLIIGLFIFLALLFLENSAYFVVSLSLLIVYILVTEICNLMYDVATDMFSFLKYIKYITLQNLIINQTKTSSNLSNFIEKKGDIVIKYYEYVGFKNWTAILFPIFELVIILNLNYLNCKIFAKKDLTI